MHLWANGECPIILTYLAKYGTTPEDQSENYLSSHEKVIYCDAPIMKISSSFIRKAIKEKKDVTYLLTSNVAKYVKEMHFYEK